MPVADRPTIGVWFFGDEEDETPRPPKTMRVEAFRLDDVDAGIAAFRTIRSRPDWTELVDPGPRRHRPASPESSPPRCRLEPYQSAYFARLPEALEAGGNLLEIRDRSRPSQAVLQVTDIAGYLAISDTRTLVWANDLASGSPSQARGPRVATPSSRRPTLTGSRTGRRRPT